MDDDMLAELIKGEEEESRRQNRSVSLMDEDMPASARGMKTRTEEKAISASQAQSDIEVVKEQAETEFQNIWENGAVEKLHFLAAKHDLKKETTQGKKEQIGEETKEEQRSWDEQLKEMTLFNSGRTEKSRRNHLSKAAQGYDKAAQELAKLQAERKAIIDAHKGKNSYEDNRDLSMQLMDLMERWEKVIAQMKQAQIDSVKATGKKDESEKKQIEEINRQFARMRLNLYRREEATPGMLPVYRDKLMEKALQLKVYEDATRTRISFAGEEFLHDYDSYKELTEEDVFEMADRNSFSTFEGNKSQLWGKFGDESFRGFTYGYVFTGNSFLVNHYLRVKHAYREADEAAKIAQNEWERKLAKEKLAAAEKDNERLETAVKNRYCRRMKLKQKEEFVERWKAEVEKTVDLMDRATGNTVLTNPDTGERLEQCNRLTHKTKVYRMVGADILDWGFGMTEEEKNLPQEEMVELINKRTGTGFVDRGYMSVGWCLDKAFASTRPFMLTLLTDQGKKCFVTRNFKEGEIIFGRNTRYMLVCAVNHANDAQVLKKSVDVSDTLQSAEELREAREQRIRQGEAGTFGFNGIELVMKVLPDDDEIA